MSTTIESEIIRANSNSGQKLLGIRAYSAVLDDASFTRDGKPYDWEGLGNEIEPHPICSPGHIRLK